MNTTEKWIGGWLILPILALAIIGLVSVPQTTVKRLIAPATAHFYTPMSPNQAIEAAP